MPIRHKFVSPVADAGDPDLVGPNEWNDSHSGDVFDSPSASIVRDECFFLGATGVYDGGIAQNASGTGAATSDGGGEVTGPGFSGVGTGVHHPGLIACATGTTTTGRCGLMSSQNLGMGKVVLYAGGVSFGVVLRPGSLSDATNTYTVWSGLNQSATGDSADGVFFRYTHSVNGGRWQGVCRSGGSETMVDTGVAATSAGGYTRLEFALNSAATEVTFSVNGTATGSSTTNIPHSVALSFMPINIVKSAGTTSRNITIDAYWYVFNFTSAR